MDNWSSKGTKSLFSRWLIVVLILSSFLFSSNAEDCDQEGDDEDDECCQFAKIKRQVAAEPSKIPDVPKLLFVEDLPRDVDFIGPYLTIPGILQSNQGLRGPLNDQPHALMAIMQPNCNFVIYTNRIGTDNALWQTGTGGRSTNCTLHANRDWTLDLRDGNGLKIWTSGLRKAYLEKAVRLHVVPTDEEKVHIRLAILNQDNTKNIVIN